MRSGYFVAKLTLARGVDRGGIFAREQDQNAVTDLRRSGFDFVGRVFRSSSFNGQLR